MKRTYRVMGILLLAATACGCHAMGPSAKPDFTADLQGQQEVPPVKTDASGQAQFFVSGNEKTIRYEIVVHNLRDVTMAHLHLGMPGVNGDHVVWLYPSSPPPREIGGVFDGILARGSFGAKRLLGPMAGKTIADLVAKMKAGGVYVNVHTKEHPDGELRGQLH